MTQGLPASFSTLIFSLSTSALSYLGIPIHPDEKPEKNLEIAQLNIDLLIMLQQKTKNNLSHEESQLLSSAINDLQIKFIAEKGKS